MTEKYSRDELRKMAKRLLEAKFEDDPRYMQFVLTLSFLTNHDPSTIEQKIRDYAAE